MTKIIEEVIASLNTDAPLRDIRVGLFHSAVLTRNCGLAATLPRDALKQEPPLMKGPGTLLSRTASELVRMTRSQSLIESAIGMATINSLLDIDETSCRNLNARELIAEHGRDKKVAIVGHFPFIPDLRQAVRELQVIEKNPQEGDLPESEAENIIPDADVIGITGTAFTNHTIEHLLELCRPDAFVVVLGDSAPLSPILFDYGINAVSGTKVINPDLAIRCISQGANFRQIKGVLRLTMIRSNKAT